MTVDDVRLEGLLSELEPRRRLQAVKGGFRRAAGVMKKSAVAALRDKVRSNRKLERGVRAVVFRQTAGFRVTVGTKGKNKGYYYSKTLGREVPLLIWMDDGTDARSTKNGRRRRAHRTGALDARLFIHEGFEARKEEASEIVRRSVVESIERTAGKYGCRT